MRFTDILKNRFILRSPLILTHRITSLCNCRCKTCDLWKKSSEYKGDLSKEEIFDMLENAKSAGMVGYAVWGGEPFFRKDLPEILQYAKKLNFITMVTTNGYLLKERYKEISQFTDFLTVSIDSHDDLHDEMRGVKGIQKRAVEGIKLCKDIKIIVINSVISNLNIEKVDGLLNLSKELGVSHAFEPMDIASEYFEPNSQFRLNQDELKLVFSRIMKFKKAGFRIANSTSYLQNFSKQKKYTCHAPKMMVTVSPHGDISFCTSDYWGNVKNKKFREIFASKEFKIFSKRAEKCNKCDVSCVIELSLLYQLNPFYLFDKVKNLFIK